MPIPSQHAEWLSLVDRTGPSLAPTVLDDVFPQGLERVDSRLRKRLRSAYEEWSDAIDDEDPELKDLHAVWVKLVLQESLGYQDGVIVARADLPEELAYVSPDGRARLTPDFALRGPDGSLRLLVVIEPPETDLDQVAPSGPWSTSPAERIIPLCQTARVPLGLLTNGERWMLVSAPEQGEIGQLSWYARIWWQEPITLRAFQSLLHVRRAFGLEEQRLEQLFEKSLAFHESMTDTLGEQVRRAVEILVQAVGRADQDRNGELLEGVSATDLYDAGLTVMMRLVFLLCAEERGLLLLDDPVYKENYAVSTLRTQLREDTDRLGLEVLERRHDAWSRLLSLFRAVFAGVQHEDLAMPAMGGSLFDPDRHPFLEGRTRGSSWREDAATPLPIDNRTVHLLLEALQVLEQRGGALFLSYKALDVEQIGHVYEGLLEYHVVEVPEVTVGLIGSQRVPHPVVTLAELEDLKEAGAERATEPLADRTGRSASAIRNALERDADDKALLGLIHACGGDEPLARRILPFARLVRQDSWGTMLVFKAGSFAVVPGDTRRETGTHYTPRSLTEEIIKTTLEPIVYVGPADGTHREEWLLRPPAELLDLKICDPAMGSGAFLVQVCRWLSERLVESWAEQEASGKAVSVDGLILDELGAEEPMPEETDDRLLLARRLISERCLYGVDHNPLAVELAKLSVWLVTLSKGRPFGFLDHNLRCGDSLLGIQSLKQLTQLELRPEDGPRQAKLFYGLIREAMEKSVDLRLRIRAIRIRDIHDVEAMARLDRQAREASERPSLLADAFIGEALRSGGPGSGFQSATASLELQAERLFHGDPEAEADLRASASESLSVDRHTGKPSRQPFHWPLEFPEVFSRQPSGFDAIVGNPPFLGGQKVTGALGTQYREYLVEVIAGGARGSADLVAYFYLRAYELIRPGGNFGLLAVNTIAEGDTRQVALEPLLRSGAIIYSAVPSQPWPGKAAVAVSLVHVHKGPWNGSLSLSGKRVRQVSAFLSDQDEWSPERLLANAGLSFQGSIILGIGFTMSEEDARSFIDRDPENAEVLFPLLNGEDLNSDPEQRASRWVINFWDWPLDRNTDGSWATTEAPQRAAWLRAGSVPADYPGHVAEDFWDLLEIVRRGVKPERQRTDDRGEYVLRDPLPERWWQYAEKRPGLYHAVRRGGSFFRHPKGWKPGPVLPRVLVTARVSKYLMFSFQPNNQVFSDATVVLCIKDPLKAAVLSSTIHEAWVRKNASRLETRLRYTPTDCFETYPLPPRADRDPRIRDLWNDYESMRSNVMLDDGIGMTDCYNRFHDPRDDDERISHLRDLHRSIDKAVAAFYGWEDIGLGHDFHETTYLPDDDRIRYTVSEEARLEVLRRLYALNRCMYEREQPAG